MSSYQEQIDEELDCYDSIVRKALKPAGNRYINSKRAQQVRQEILRCARPIVLNYLDTANAKAIFTQNTVDFHWDRSAMADYFIYRGADIEISRLTWTLKDDLAKEIPKFRNRKQVERWFLSFLNEFQFHEEDVKEEWGDESLALIKDIRAKMIWGIYHQRPSSNLSLLKQNLVKVYVTMGSLVIRLLKKKQK